MTQLNLISLQLMVYMDTLISEVHVVFSKSKHLILISVR